MPPKHKEDSLPRDKLLVLYQRLTLDGRRHFLGDIARDLECSPQTVTRLVGTIERHLGKDAFIESGLDGRRRYFRFCSKSQGKGLGFSFEELHFLATCRDLAAPFLPEGIATRIDRTLTNLALSLGELSPSGLPVGFRSKGFIDYGPHMATIATLRQAIDKRQICRVNYKAAGREQTSSYRYAPGTLLVMGGTLYVQGWRLAEGSLLQDRPTTFSLHRICGIEPTGEYFRFNAVESDDRSFGLNWHEPLRMRVHIAQLAADYVRVRIWSDDQIIDDHPDGSITLCITTTSEKELNAWAAGFGGLARIVESQPEGN